MVQVMQWKSRIMQRYGADYKTLDGWKPPPATSRHTRRLLRLLPSGPGRVHRLVLREDQWGPP